MSNTKWAIDPTHSEIGFKIKHLMFTNVYGRFETFEGFAETDEYGENIQNITFTADASSVNTGNSDRDGHLKGQDFFDTEKYPKINFTSVELRWIGEKNYNLIGDLTIRDTTKQVSLLVENNGTMVDPWGNTKMGFSVTGKINRVDFGLTWNSPLEAGGVLVGEDVKFNIEVQLVKQ